MDEVRWPVTVEGDWGPDQARAARSKLQLYFQNQRKSGGGECRGEAEDGAPRAAVIFGSEEVRERVLARDDHQIVLQDRTFRLRLTPAATPTNSDDVSDSSTGSETLTSHVGPGAAAAHKHDSAAVVLHNVSDAMSRDLLLILVENVSGFDASGFSLELIRESNRAVVAFNKPADAEKFVSVSRTSAKMQKHGLTARPLEAAKSVRVEGLPDALFQPCALNSPTDMLELYFDKRWALPDDIIMIPSEQAAIVSFSDPKVVQSVCLKEDHVFGSNPIKVYPYNEFLGATLYGKERPTWQMPKPFTESVHHAIWKFLLMKKQLQGINDQMRPYFCSVDLDNPVVKLGPLPSILSQRDMNAKRLDNWMSTAQTAFRQLMSQYSAFECPVNAPAWKAAEKEVRSVVREDAVLVPDASRQALIVAGQADDIKRIRAPVENIVLKAMSQIERQTNRFSDKMILSPAMFYILKQAGLQKASFDISPEMNISYDEGAKKLTISGLPEEVYKTKDWILERNVNMSKKQLIFPPCLLDFLKTVDPMDTSQDLFTSHGISAIYTIDHKGLILLGNSDSVLADAESRMNKVLSAVTLDVEDQEVLKLNTWVDLNQQLLDTYNSSKKKTVAIQIPPERRDKVTVSGFENPVKEVGRSLKKFIVNYARVQETIRVESCAVVQFIDKKKSHDLSSILKANDVTVDFDSERPRITIIGARLHVHKARSCLQEVINALSTDKLTMDKPGAKKYFQSQGSLFLSTMLTEFNCAVVLRPDNQDEWEEEESGLCYCQVRTTGGVLISVSKADICSFNADAVVNAANEELQHIGGLALGLLKGAGPQLQKLSDDYISKHGHLRPGDAIVTAAGNLPCKYVVHAVGPRFSEADKRISVSRLKLAVQQSLKQAEAVNCSSVALPAISSGVFGFPVDLCAETIAQAVREYCDSPRRLGTLTEIHLVDNFGNTVRALAKAVNQEFIDLGPTMTVPQQGGQRGAGAARPGGMERITAEGLKIVLYIGNIQDQKTEVIVNTISENLDLNQGGVSKAILGAAGAGLQSAVLAEARAATLQHGEVAITGGFNLACREVFHVVCPAWDNGGGQAEQALVTIVSYCLEAAEKRKMRSLSFPAIGTGNLSFPRDVVSRVLHSEIHAFSRRRSTRHLRAVVIVVHPGDTQTVDCFTREFKGQAGQRHVQHEAQESPAVQPLSQSQPTSASFGRVSSPSLGVYQMQMGPLSLEVSSGDITKEASDVIVNSSNQDFNLKTGVSKAILDSAGTTVETECSRKVKAPGYLPGPLIITSAGLLPSRAIVHVVGQSDPAKIKDVVYSVLKVCEEKKFCSVSFPALGTGQGGANPTAVADAMVEAVVEFVRKKHPRFVHCVKILIFQTTMMTEFHKSMKQREGEEVEAKSVFTKFKDSVTSFFGLGEERPGADDLVLEGEEFEPVVFQLCADSHKALSQAKKRINELIVAEQATKTISDPYISQLTQADMDQLRDLQRKLMVSICLDKGLEDQEPNIRLEGLTRDVLIADSAVRDVIRRVERMENQKSMALMLTALVEWQFQHPAGIMVPFDMYTNLNLEEALKKKQSVKIKINNQTFTADVILRKAVSANGQKEVELLRKEVKGDDALPPRWEAMKGDLVKLFPLTLGSQEYSEVVQEFTKTSLTANIISIERVQNVTLWQSYQLMKKQLEVKNKHTNNEKLLFHGTGANAIGLINDKGFNRSYAGVHGAMFGNGSYFAVDPAYSAQGYAKPDASGHKRIYLSRVLVGDYTLGRGGLITPPSKGSVNAADLYDSVADNPANPTMFVVFNDIQAYPEYLITFT
ncbi:putative poly [Scophthalmus maximus]|uniref:Poly [ADP-ribose] polymerase n=1 Tax=Scophthalmus maximus TaxID=52904 RepID=A0A2U9BU12_SCOMX|nr:putative poly [Scophthalmus maximus]